MNRPHSLRGLSAQLLLFIVLPLFLALSAIALGSVFAHQRSMRALVGERDLRAVRVAAAALSASGGLEDEQVMHAVLGPLQAGTETVMLVDAQRRIVYDTEPALVGQSISHPGVTEALAGGSGLLYRRDQPGGQEHVVAYAPVSSFSTNEGNTNWALIVEEPWGEVLNPWLRISLLGPLILVPAIAAALVALWFAVQRVIRPLQRLDAQVTALGWGNFKVIEAPVGGIAEIQELQRALMRMAAQVHAYQQSMRGYLGAVTSAQEDERKRLARELHDQTIQDLIALNQRVQMARRKKTDDPRAQDARLAELQTMIEAIMGEVRRLSRALRPIYLEEAGLVAALKAMANDMARDGLQITFDADGPPRRLAPETELALYRIVQEALNNALRHAHASSIRVDVKYDQGVTIRVQDDGVGFVAPQQVSTLAANGHFGLMGMQERAQLVGAQLVVHSHPGTGTTVEVHWRPTNAAIGAPAEQGQGVPGL